MPGRLGLHSTADGGIAVKACCVCVWGSRCLLSSWFFGATAYVHKAELVGAACQLKCCMMVATVA